MKMKIKVNHKANELHEALGVSAKRINEIVSKITNRSLCPSEAVEAVAKECDNIQELIAIIYVLGFNHAMTMTTSIQSLLGGSRYVPDA